MKRQVAIRGATPQFLRWSIRRACPLRHDSELRSIDQTEKRLRAVRAAGLAIGQNRVFEGIAVKDFEDGLRAFRIDDVLDMWGGKESVDGVCGQCPANILKEPKIHGALAGCHGWLKTPAGPCRASRLEMALSPDQRVTLAEHFPVTNPVWFGLWTTGELQGEQLMIVSELFRHTLCSNAGAAEAAEFCKVLDACYSNQLVLDVELVPAGFSDGSQWTIAAHCDFCKAPFSADQDGCDVCGKSGKGHPLIRKRVLGLRPYVDLAIVVGESQVNDFRDRHNL